MKLQDIINGMTPGPWVARSGGWSNSGREGGIVVTDDTPRHWAIAYTRATDLSYEQANANADAIALAPKGVKALMLLREVAEHWEGTDAPIGIKARALIEGIEP